MRRLLIAALAAAAPTAGVAHGATLALPSVVFTSPASTSIACTETAAANLVVPVAAGTVIFSCTVTPSTWSGTVTGVAAPFAVPSGAVGSAFNVTLATAVTAAGTDAPGTLVTTP